jgi:hypothetical protein
MIVNYDRNTFIVQATDLIVSTSLLLYNVFVLLPKEAKAGQAIVAVIFMANSVNVNKPLRLARYQHELTHLQSRCRRWVMKIEFFLIHYVFCLSLSKGINIYHNEYASIIVIYFYKYFL